MKALKICIIVAWLIALAMFLLPRSCTVSVKNREPEKAIVQGDESMFIGHKTIEFPTEPKPLPTNLVMETDGQFYRIVDPKSPLGHWVIVGGSSQYSNKNDALRAYWEMHSFMEANKAKTWKPVEVSSDIPANTEKGEAIINGKKHYIVEGLILRGKVIDEHGITYYLSSEGLWHSNRVVDDFYLNDKTQTWEEYKP